MEAVGTGRSTRGHQEGVSERGHRTSTFTGRRRRESRKEAMTEGGRRGGGPRCPGKQRRACLGQAETSAASLWVRTGGKSDREPPGSWELTAGDTTGQVLTREQADGSSSRPLEGQGDRARGEQSAERGTHGPGKAIQRRPGRARRGGKSPRAAADGHGTGNTGAGEGRLDACGGPGVEGRWRAEAPGISRQARGTHGPGKPI